MFLGFPQIVGYSLELLGSTFPPHGESVFESQSWHKRRKLGVLYMSRLSHARCTKKLKKKSPWTFPLVNTVSFCNAFLSNFPAAFVQKKTLQIVSECLGSNPSYVIFYLCDQIVWYGRFLQDIIFYTLDILEFSEQLNYQKIVTQTFKLFNQKSYQVHFVAIFHVNKISNGRKIKQFYMISQLLIKRWDFVFRFVMSVQNMNVMSLLITTGNVRYRIMENTYKTCAF